MNDDQIKESVINNGIQNDRIQNAAHKPKRLFRWRIVFAVLLSILLHLVLIPDFDFNNTPPKPLILTATLTSDTYSQTDDTDQRGELDTNEKINQAATAKKANISPDPPKARPTTAPPPTKTALTPKQPKSPQQPSAVKQEKLAETPKKTVEKVIPKHSSMPMPAAEVRQASSQRAQHQGGQEVFSNPIEQAYYETLIDHLNKKLPSHPEGISGQLRLQVKIEYSAIITSVTIIDHSGNSATDDWAIRAMLSVSPVPAVPPELAQPYYFRPTLVLTK